MISEYLKSRGLPAQNIMHEQVKRWDSWYTTKNKFYKYKEVATHERRTYQRERMSLKIAKLVCEEWASLIFNEQTRISTDHKDTDDFLKSWMDYNCFIGSAQQMAEFAFAHGTSAFALTVSGITDQPSVQIPPTVELQKYCAQDIIPLSWADGVCTECAFVSDTFIRGKRYRQLLIYLKGEQGTYTCECVLFDEQGHEQMCEEVLPFIDLGCVTPPFCLLKPGLSNKYDFYGCMGVSVFDSAIDAIKLTDEAADNMFADIELGRKMVALSEKMLAREIIRDPKTKEIVSDRYVVPQERGASVFLLGDNDGEYFKEYNPALRVEENRRAIQTGLELVGSLSGLGLKYFTLDGDNGIKTAREVVAEHSALFRSIRKHENSFAPAIETLLRSVVEISNALCHTHLSIPQAISVDFDDSVIEDTEALEKRDRERVQAGLLGVWEYRVHWYGEDEKTAKERSQVDTQPIDDESFSVA